MVSIGSRRKNTYREKPLKIERERTTDEQKEELLREWCSEHDGKYYVTTERRCVVKE